MGWEVIEMWCKPKPRILSVIVVLLAISALFLADSRPVAAHSPTPTFGSPYYAMAHPVMAFPRDGFLAVYIMGLTFYFVGQPF